MIILIVGRPKTGKTKLGKILTGLLKARLIDSDDPEEADKVLAQYPHAVTSEVIVVTVPVYKSQEHQFYGGSHKAAIADLIIEMPSMKVIKDRGGIVHG